MKMQQPDKNTPQIKEPAIPDVPEIPNKPPKKEGDNDHTREKPNDPTKQPGQPVKEPNPTQPNPKS
jgi:hypothetical protein